MPWTFKHATTDQPFSAWGFSACRLSMLNQSKGEFVCEVAGDARASLPFAVDDKVELRLDGVLKWVGYYTGPRRIEGRAESVQLTFADAWHLLEQSPFINESTGETLLFALPDYGAGTGLAPVTLAAQIGLIIDAAAAYFPGSMQSGAAPGAFYPPPLQMQVPTCAEALQACLRYAPDAITQWDYSTTPPTLNIVPRADASTVTLSAHPESGVLDEFDALPRYDLQARGVVIAWWQQAQGEAPTVVYDQAGASTGPRILRHVFQLKAPQVVPAITQSVTIESAADLDESSAAFWSTLGGVKADAADIIVGTSSRTGSSLGRRFISGMVPSWLNVSAHLGEVALEAYLTYKNYLSASDHSLGYTVVKAKHSISFQVTDLNGTYTRTVQAGYTIPGDEPVYGLAEFIYNAASLLQWEGSATSTNADSTLPVRLGDLLNISNASAGLATMAAQVHALELDFDAGRTSIRFGPSAHLSPQDWLSIQKQMRRDPAAEGLAARASNVAPPSTPAEIVESTPAPPRTVPAGGNVAVQEMNIRKGDYKFTLDVEAGTMKLEHTSNTANSFNVQLTNASEPLTLHMAVAGGGELVLKPRPMKICVLEEGEVVEKKHMVFMSQHSDNITVP